MIYDCFIFSGEWDILRLRINELKGLDVTYVIVESAFTHSGKEKRLLFLDNTDSTIMDAKIIYCVDNNILVGTPRENEAHQRNYISVGLANANPDDIVIISDVDEIPRREAVLKYKKEMGLTSLKMDNFYFWLNLMTSKQGWDMPKIMTKQYLDNVTPDQARTSGYPSTIENAGWHFSWQGGIDKVMEKFRNFSHQEEAVQKHADYEKVKAKIESGQSLWGEDYWEFVEIDDTFPEGLKHNKQAYSHMIKEFAKPKIENKLCGTLFIYNGLSQDYSYREAIASLQALCDHVIIVDAGSTDGTLEDIKLLGNGKTTLISLDKSAWDAQRGREKLNFFTNIAIEKAQEMGYEWQINLQADEVIHEDSFKYIREAIALGEEAYCVTRINLWGNPNTMLNVPQNRKPVSTQIIRLTKTKYRSVGDAESIGAHASSDYINKINIFHTGFVRDRKKHIEKIKHMQRDVFLMDYDKRADLSETFNPWQWGFEKTDVIPIDMPLPMFMKKWAEERTYID